MAEYWGCLLKQEDYSHHLCSLPFTDVLLMFEKRKTVSLLKKNKNKFWQFWEKKKSHHSGCMRVKNPNIKASPLPKITQIPARSQRQLFPAHNWRVIVVESLCTEPQRLAQELCFWLAWVTAVNFKAVSPITAEEEHKWFSHRRVSSPVRPRSQSVFLWKCGQKKITTQFYSTL